MYNLNGKVALVTGAGGERGFGRAIADRLADEGADVAVSDLTQAPHGPGINAWDGLDAVAHEIEAKGRRSLTVLADVTNANAVDAMVESTIASLGKIDILVANAGAPEGPDHVPVVDLDADVFDLVQRVNVKGTFLTVRAVARQMIKRHSEDPTQGGRILIMSSLAGKRGMPLYAAYCASKFALVGLTQSLAHELGPHNITVNALCPGFVPTERALGTAGALRQPNETTDQHIAAMIQKRETATALGRIGSVDDVAGVAAFLASDQAQYLTGLAVSISGGEVMW
jgi:NAD(P)-dependent dehydrogenase (short-subunit alcohol dehydrogenase family)